jgi:microcystin-dependent protein
LTRIPDSSIFNQNQTGDSGFENVYVYGKFNYDFSGENLNVKSLNVTGISSFTSDVTFTGDITLDEITARNANVTGVATVGTGLYLNGKLFDGDGDFGTAGQLLSSDGTDLNWIDASTTSVANANNVGTNANSTNADQFITFVSASSGNNPIRVNSNIKYNPSTNTLSAINIAGSSTAVNLNVTGNLTVGGQFKDGDGNFGTSGQVLSSDGTDTAWINAGSLTAGAAAEVGVSAATVNADHFVTMVDTASGNENVRVDTDLKYNPVTNTLTATNFAGSGTGLTGIEAFVTGMIILWSGAANAIPSGFVLCNGSNSTPDLRGRFVVGYSNTDGDYDVGDAGGSKQVTLSESQLPSHNHSASSSVNDPGHFHSYIDQYVVINNGYRPWPANNNDCAQRNINTGSQTTGISVSTTIGNTGSGSAIENRPPYYALCYIMKT